MIKTLLLILLMSSSALADRLDFALAASAGFDTQSTLIAQHRGFQEQNPIAAPFMKHPASAYAFTAGTTTAEILAAKWLKDFGHPRWANVLRLAVTGSHVTFGIRNLRLK